MKDALQDYMARPKRYDNIDGTGEMYMGLMLLGFALIGYLQASLSEHSVWRSNWLASLALMYGILVPVLAIGFVLQRLIKKRITWPRTGYVAYGPDRKSRSMAIFLVAVIAAVVAAILAIGFACLTALGQTHHGAIGLARAGYLAFWLPLYAFWVFKMGREQRWKWLVLVFMALGLVAIGLIVPGGFIELSRPVMLFVGLVWIGSGGGTLLSYLRRTRRLTVEPR